MSIWDTIKKGRLGIAPADSGGGNSSTPGSTASSSTTQGNTPNSNASDNNTTDSNTTDSNTANSNTSDSNTSNSNASNSNTASNNTPASNASSDNTSTGNTSTGNTSNSNQPGSSTPPASGTTGPGQTAGSSAATGTPASGASDGETSALGLITNRWMSAPAGNAAPNSALNQKIVQAVQTGNAETAAYAINQVAVPPNMMISQAAGLVAQSAAAYFDGVSKLALASQGVLLKLMTENIAKKDMQGAADDAVGALLTDVLVGAAAAVAAAVGVVEATPVENAIKTIDQSITSTKQAAGG